MSEARHLPPQGFWAYFVRAARPTAIWACVGVLLVNGVILPLARLWGVSVEPLDWQGLAVFGATAFGLGAQRSFDKKIGAAS